MNVSGNIITIKYVCEESRIIYYIWKAFQIGDDLSKRRSKITIAINFDTAGEFEVNHKL